MKNKYSKLMLVAVGAVALSVAGCLAPNPDHATNPNAPAYIVNPAVSNYQAQAQSVLPVVSAVVAATPAAPAAPFIPDAANLIFGAITLASGILAVYKNKQAANHAAAAASLAATVTAAGPTVIADATKNAAANGSSATVAEHLADAANPVQL